MTENEQKKRWQKKSTSHRDRRVDFFLYSMAFFAFVLFIRLFWLQVVNYGYYQALASGQRENYQEIAPTRGDIYIHDLKDGNIVPVATNQKLAFIYADPREVVGAVETAETLGKIFGYEEEEVLALAQRIDKEDDPYEPIERYQPDAVLETVMALELPGIHYMREEHRFYPEAFLGGHVVGFLGVNEDGSLSGKYGVEGYFDEELSGKVGFIHAERDIAGRLIATGTRSIERAQDGADVVLTLDRTIQYEVCSSVKKAVLSYKADSGSAVVLDPNTGRILAMCGYPDFDPNNYSEVDSVAVFNNPTIFNAYEPGSIFKPITMAAALDSGAVTPTDTFVDPGEYEIDDFKIKNSDKKAHGLQTMTEILENSLNTGMIYTMRQTGQDLFVDYVKRFGFGEKTNIKLDTEAKTDISLLDIRGAEIYAATASFGQGITVTPLQMAMAYGALANGGMLKRPYIIDEIRYSDGRVDKTEVTDIRRVIESKTARLLGAMMISVIENGHAALAGVPGYYIAGKTGTAQIAKQNTVGYEKDAVIASFVGFGPVEDPKFVIITRIDRPQDAPWASQTAAPLFGEIAKFLVKYMQIPPTRSVE